MSIVRSIFRIKEPEMTNPDEMTAWDFTSSELPFYDELYKTGVRMTHSVAETEDLLQETYLKAFRYYSGFEEGTNLKAWLFRIMKKGRDRTMARATLGRGLAVSAFRRYVPV